MRRQNTTTERYKSLGLKESLNGNYLYPVACKELAFILRNAYQKAPKNLQALIFQDLLTAFSILPQMQTQRAVSSANILLQSAEASLQKQKRASAVTEFKHAIVAHKRRSKGQQDQQDLKQLPQDVLVHIFSFLDLQSLICAAAVCRLWSAAASDNHLWKAVYSDFFGAINILKVNSHQFGVDMNKDNRTPKKDLATGSRIDWRDAFKKASRGSSQEKFKSYWGYCRKCRKIVWLSHTKCSFIDTSEDNLKTHQIKTLSSQQIVDYVLDDSLSSYSSSDSDSDADVEDSSVLKLWARTKY